MTFYILSFDNIFILTIETFLVFMISLYFFMGFCDIPRRIGFLLKQKNDI